MRLRVLFEPTNGAGYQRFQAMALAAEEAGFDGFFRSDHLIGVDPGRPYEATDAWTVLAGLARDTSRIRLGALVTAGTFRHPGVLAASVAAVDQMSDGRVDFAIGAGWLEAEHVAFGLPFPELRERFDRLAEQIEIITGLWETPCGESFTFAGKHYELANPGTSPRTVQSPRPPVIIGGTGARRTPLLGARFADEFNLSFPTGAHERSKNFDRICTEFGRDPEAVRKSVILPVACGESEADIARRKRAIDAEPLLAEAVVGRPEAVAERLGRLRDEGVDTVYFHIYDPEDVEHVHLLGTEVGNRL